MSRSSTAGALGALEHVDHQRLLGAGARRPRRGALGPRVGRLAGLGLTHGVRRLGGRRARVGPGGGLWRVVLGLDADGLEAGAGDPEWRRVVAARGALVIDQALGLEAAEDLVDGAALDLEGLGQRQDRAVIALGSRTEDDGLVSLSLVMG